MAQHMYLLIMDLCGVSKKSNRMIEINLSLLDPGFFDFFFLVILWVEVTKIAMIAYNYGQCIR